MSDKSSGAPLLFCKGTSIISGYRENCNDADSIVSLIDEIQKLEADIMLQYCSKDKIFTILTDADMEESVLRGIKMFATGFLKASNITTTEER